MDYATQSGVVDEYDGKVSRMATTAANMASTLSKIPLLYPYARASEMALRGVGAVATLFGYSRPVVTEIEIFKPAYVSNLANVNAKDTSQKLATDIKQEITIDPRTVGLGSTDEMTIQSIVSRSAYLGTFTWEVAKGAGSRLATFGVTPYSWNEHVVDGVESFYFPPCCHAALAFNDWRGSMKYRFQIVASNFHKGRLQIQYDPFHSYDYNFSAAFNRVIDISEQRDFTVEIGWGIPENYGVAINPGTEELPYRLTNTALDYPTIPWKWNGQLSVRVLNDLTVPNSAVNNDVHVNVFISCGDDFEFQNPTNEMIDSMVFKYPNAPPGLQDEIASVELSSQEVFDTQSGQQLVADDVATADSLGKPSVVSPLSQMANVDTGASKLADVCFGERIVSFRSLIKRFSLHEVINFSHLKTAATGAIWTVSRQKAAFPSPRGRYANSVYQTADGASYWYVHNHLLNWLTERMLMMAVFTCLHRSSPKASASKLP